jgi:ATP-dependent Clp protease, protease subunit
MNSKIKKVIVGLVVFVAVAIIPLVSVGKAANPNQIVLTTNNMVNLSGEITGDSVANTILELQKLDDDSKKPIYLFMYTPGGSVQDGLELIEAIKGLNRPVETITLFSASMGFQTVQALGKRLIMKNGTLMSHRAAGSFEGSFGGQFPSQIDSRYGFWLQRIKELDEQTVSRTNGRQTMKSYLETYKNEAWFTGTQAVEQGYADAIVTVHCDKSLTGVTPHSVSFMGLSFTYEISNCPMITSPLNVKTAGSKADPIMLDEIKTRFLESFSLEKLVK